MEEAHPGLAWASATEAGREWLEHLPRLVRECVEQWSLEVGEPFPYAFASLALAVRLPDGGDAVLKICFPHRESEHEADALARWNGEGAVRLLAHDRDRWALLIERCSPGRHLRELEPGAALEVMIGLLPRLWVPAGEPFRPLAEEAAWWASYLLEKWEGTGRPFERELLDAALDALCSLSASQGEQVLVNQDLHADNVLAAEREPWLVIDPKPYVGDPAYDPLQHLLNCLDRLRADPDRLVARMADLCGVDRERLRLWLFARGVVEWRWFDVQDVVVALAP